MFQIVSALPVEPVLEVVPLGDASARESQDARLHVLQPLHKVFAESVLPPVERVLRIQRNLLDLDRPRRIEENRECAVRDRLARLEDKRVSLPFGKLEVDGLLCRRDAHVFVGDLRLAEDASAAFEDAPQAAPVAVESARIEREVVLLPRLHAYAAVAEVPYAASIARAEAFDAQMARRRGMHGASVLKRYTCHRVSAEVGLPTLEILRLPVESAVLDQLWIHPAVRRMVDVLEEDSVQRLRNVVSLRAGIDCDPDSSKGRGRDYSRRQCRQSRFHITPVL